MSNARVLIADHNTILREALKAILGSEQDVAITGEASTVSEALEMISADSPDIVITSIYLPNKGCHTLMEQARMVSPAIKFIVFSLGRSKEVKQLLFEMRACGLLKTNAGVDEIKKAVRTVYDGETYIDPQITDILLASAIDRKGTKLSDRQLQILTMISEGFTNKRISAELGISQDTVKTHVRIILKKLGAADRAQAVSRAYEFAILK